MATIYLIRHGQASFAAEDYDQLSSLGEEQARLLGSVLKPRLPQVDKIVSGDMRRHRQTAAGCMGAMGLNTNLVEDTGWNEFDHREVIARFEPRYRDVGAMARDFLSDANPKIAFQAMFAQAMTRWMSGTSDHEYAESWVAFSLRVRTSLERLTAGLDTEQTALVFTSGGPIAVVAGHLFDMPTPAVARLSWTLVNAAVTKLSVGSHGTTVATLNDHSHFEGAQRSLLTYR